MRDRKTCFSQLCGHLPGKPDDLITVCETPKESPTQEVRGLLGLTSSLPGVSGTDEKTKKLSRSSLGVLTSLPGTFLEASEAAVVRGGSSVSLFRPLFPCSDGQNPEGKGPGVEKRKEKGKRRQTGILR